MGFPNYVKRGMCFTDPFTVKMHCVHRRHSFPVITKRYILSGVAILQRPLKFSATIFQGKDIHYLEGTHYKRIHKKQFLPISPVGRIRLNICCLESLQI